MTVIAAAGLCKSFAGPWGKRTSVLEDVSFSCQAGEVFGLLGPNGAGKSTTMRILSTVLKPTAGSASVAGFDVVREPSRVRQNIGFLSASTGLYDRMDAWEHVEYFGRLGGLAGEPLRERIEALFDALRINEFRRVLVAKLSTGMKQKVSIARALVHDPPVLILDEPTTGLDVLAAREVLRTVERLRAIGKCVVYSTHILAEVDQLCDRLAILHHGRLLATGNRRDLLAEHRSIGTAELIFDLLDRGTPA